MEATPIIELNGAAESVVFALHKPRKLTVARLPERKAGSGVPGRRGCFASWLTELEAEAALPAKSLFAVGRLDKDTSGLLVVTNDGDLAYALTRRGVCRKRYVARCRVTDASLQVALNNHATGDASWPTASAAPWAAFAALARQRLSADGVVLSAQKVDKGKAADAYTVHFDAVDVLDVRTERRIVPVPAAGSSLQRKQLRNVTPDRNHLGSSSIISNVDDDARAAVADPSDAACSEARAPPPRALQTIERTEVDVAVEVAVGQFRVVRRALAAVGLPVFALRRSNLGPLDLGALGILESQHRRLCAAAVAQLWQSVGGREAVGRFKAADKAAARDGNGGDSDGVE